MNCSNSIEHTVEAGDTLYKLSRQYKTTVSSIILSNPRINPYNLQIGMKIEICPGREYTRPEMSGNTKSCAPLLPGPHPRRHAANFSTGRAETVEKSAHFAGKLPVSLQLCYILPLPLAIKRLLRYTDIQ